MAPHASDRRPAPRRSGSARRTGRVICDRIICEPLECRRLMAAGDPDLAFSNDGVAGITFPGALFQVNDVALQSDGKVVAVGTTAGSLAVTRFNVDGTVDTSFGNAGLFESDRRAQATSVAIQQDNKILLTFGVEDSFQSMQVGRLHANGTAFDSAFGNNGIASVSGVIIHSGNTVAVQPDGKIIVAGMRHSGSQDFEIARYNPDGSPDLGFDDDGLVVVGFGEDEQAFAVAVDDNGDAVSNPFYGTIVVVGDKRPSTSEPSTRFTICRLLSDGTLDNRFDADGKITSPDLTPLPGESPAGVQIQPGGKIVVSGTALATSGTPTGNFLLARYLSNGAIDTTYGPFGSGIVHDEFGGDERAADAATNTVGGLLVSGSRDGVAAVAAYTRDGLPETRFSGDGFMTAPFGGPAHVVTTLDAVPPPRRVILAGTRSVGRYIDVGTVVTLGAGLTDTGEDTRRTLNVFVSRREAEPTAERVYIDIGGTARAPIFGLPSTWDYSAAGITLAGFNVPRNYVDIPAGEAFTTFSITPINDAEAEGDETVVLGVSEDAAYDIGTPAGTTLVIRDDDLTGGPAVNASAFVFDAGPPQRVTFRFNQNVQSSIGGGDFSVTGPSGPVPFTFAYDGVGNTATLSFNGVLPNGNYTARAVAAGITNGGGQPMAADATLAFFALAGDVNRDRMVNGTDFAILAANFGRTGRTYGEGDLNGDAAVNGTDFAILAGNFGKALPEPQAAAAQLPAAQAPVSSSPAAPSPARRSPAPAGAAPRAAGARGATAPRRRAVLRPVQRRA